jgi:hypothetical protein
MPDEPKDVRLPLMVSRSEAAAIDEWRYANKVPTRAQAIRQLIEAGLKATNLSLSGGRNPGSSSSSKPGGKPAPHPRKPAAPRSKLEQIRALREQGAR